MLNLQNNGHVLGASLRTFPLEGFATNIFSKAVIIKTLGYAWVCLRLGFWLTVFRGSHCNVVPIGSQIIIRSKTFINFMKSTFPDFSFCIHQVSMAVIIFLFPETPSYSRICRYGKKWLGYELYFVFLMQTLMVGDFLDLSHHL